MAGAAAGTSSGSGVFSLSPASPSSSSPVVGVDFPEFGASATVFFADAPARERVPLLVAPEDAGTLEVPAALRPRTPRAGAACSSSDGGTPAGVVSSSLTVAAGIRLRAVRRTFAAAGAGASGANESRGSSSSAAAASAALLRALRRAVLGLGAGAGGSSATGVFVMRVRHAAALAGVLRAASGSVLAARVLRRRGLLLPVPASSSLASLVAPAFFLVEDFVRDG